MLKLFVDFTIISKLHFIKAVPKPNGFYLTLVAHRAVSTAVGRPPLPWEPRLSAASMGASRNHSTPPGAKQLLREAGMPSGPL